MVWVTCHCICGSRVPEIQISIQRPQWEDGNEINLYQWFLSIMRSSHKREHLIVCRRLDFDFKNYASGGKVRSVSLQPCKDSTHFSPYTRIFLRNCGGWIYISHLNNSTKVYFIIYIYQKTTCICFYRLNPRFNGMERITHKLTCTFYFGLISHNSGFNISKSYYLILIIHILIRREMIWLLKRFMFGYI